MMYLSGMIREEFGCDYPGCCERFDPTEGAQVAILKNKTVLAFCREHAAQLRASGVALGTLSEVNKAREAASARHEAFVAHLKE